MHLNFFQVAAIICLHFIGVNPLKKLGHYSYICFVLAGSEVTLGSESHRNTIYLILLIQVSALQSCISSSDYIRVTYFYYVS